MAVSRACEGAWPLRIGAHVAVQELAEAWVQSTLLITRFNVSANVMLDVVAAG